MNDTADQKELWCERITVTEPVLDALIADHNSQKSAFIESIKGISTNALMESLGGMLATGDCDWYVEPAKKTCASVDKLSKGFAMAASQIAAFFDDIYVGKDFRDVLLNPEQAPASYPNTIDLAYGYFLKTVSKYLPKDFWARNKELEDVQTSLSFVGDFAANEQTMSEQTALICLFYAQRMSRVMPLAAEELRNSGHANLATIADCFATKGKTMSEDIITKVNTAISSNQTLNIIADHSIAPQDSATPT